MTFSQFLHLNDNFPQLLFPAFRLQRSIMHYVLGDRWWDATKRRIQAQKDRERALTKQVRGGSACASATVAGESEGMARLPRRAARAGRERCAQALHLAR